MNTIGRDRLDRVKGFATIGGATRSLRKSGALEFGTVLRTEVILNANRRYVPVAFVDGSNGFQAAVILAHRGIFVTDREFA